MATGNEKLIFSLFFGENMSCDIIIISSYNLCAREGQRHWPFVDSKHFCYFSYS